MKKVLTPDLIQAKTRCDNLFLIKNLNLWGNEIEDIKLLRQMPNLEILSLSVNRINSLKEFSNCKKLQELYLRKNNISDLEEIKYLVGLPDLRILWLLDNPCAEQENYREIVIGILPNIKKLDNNEVTSEERKQAEIMKNEVKPKKQGDFLKNEMDFQRKEEEYVKNDFEFGGKIAKKEGEFLRNEKKIEFLGNDSPVQHKQKTGIHEEKAGNKQDKELFKRKNDGVEQRKENVLCAVLALVKELDYSELEFIKRDIDRRLGNNNQWRNPKQRNTFEDYNF